jgi:hypothetical protein
MRRRPPEQKTKLTQQQLDERNWRIAHGAPCSTAAAPPSPAILSLHWRHGDPCAVVGSSTNREQAWASQRPRVVAAGADEAVADGQAVPTAVATLRCSRALVYSLISSDLCLSWAAIFPCRGGFCQRLFLDAVTLH